MIVRYREIAGKSRHVNGWRPEAGDHRHWTPPMESLASVTRLPRAIDLASRWPAIKNQGQVGDCTANAVLECYEYFQPLRRRQPLSRLYLYAYTRIAEGTPLSEDSGAQVGTAVQVETDRGAPFEADWDYTDPEVRYKLLPPKDLDSKAAQHRSLFWYRCVDLATLKASLAQGFPACFGFRCPESIFSDSTLTTGLIHYPDPGEGFDGGHSTGICGYDDDLIIGREKGALKLANSWGTEVGQRGYFWLPYRYVHEGIAGGIYTIRRVSGTEDTTFVPSDAYATTTAPIVLPTLPPPSDTVPLTVGGA